MRCHFPWILLVLCASCASNPVIEPVSPAVRIAIEAVVIRNDLAFPVTDVQIIAPATGNFVACGQIWAGTECATTFPTLEYQADPVIVSWKEYGQPHSTGEFVIEIPDSMTAGEAARLIVTIFAMGQAGARLVQANDSGSVDRH